MKLDELDTLARTIYGEARSEGLAGMEAVASVVMNRLQVAGKHRGQYWWGNNVKEICLKDWQFSCWNLGDPNLEKIRAVDDGDPHFEICKRVAARALAGVLKDSTGGATHYHTKAVNPKWAQSRTPTAQIGAHLFYKLEG